VTASEIREVPASVKSMEPETSTTVSRREGTVRTAHCRSAPETFSASGDGSAA
jgi:hypothetical protein